MTGSWTDFNDAKEGAAIPKGTLAKVRLSIRPGGFDDPSMGWTGGYVTRNENTGACYLNGEFTVLEGPYARRKIFSLIGLYSPKGPEWANMGRAFVRTMLNSARGLRSNDNSPQAQAARRISGFADLDGLEFVARIDVEDDQFGDPKNVVKGAVTPDHQDYGRIMGTPMVPGMMPGTGAPTAPQHPQYHPSPSAPQGVAPAPPLYPQQQPQPGPQQQPAPPAQPGGFAKPKWAQ